MVALFCLGIAFAVVTGVTFYALISAKEGYEDAVGFHDLARSDNSPVRFELRREPTSEAAPSRPFVAAS